MPNGQVRIDVEAARALTEWKSLFAEAVCEEAKQIAAQSGHPDSVTLPDYRAAARIAIRSLSDAIQGEHGTDGKHEAA